MKCLVLTDSGIQDLSTTMVTTYKETGEVNEVFEVISYELVETIEDGVPVTYFYYEPVNE